MRVSYNTQYILNNLRICSVIPWQKICKGECAHFFLNKQARSIVFEGEGVIHPKNLIFSPQNHENLKPWRRRILTTSMYLLIVYFIFYVLQKEVEGPTPWKIDFLNVNLIKKKKCCDKKFGGCCNVPVLRKTYFFLRIFVIW